MEKNQKIEELVAQLNEAADAYYSGKDELMSNYEWDAAFDELKKLEEETGYILPNSPTQTVGGEEDVSGEKEPHEFSALSLAKTKSVEELQKWAGDKDVWLSWKLDGLTLVLTYDNGQLTKILTRGDGHIGTNITHLKGLISGMPMQIPFARHLVVRGEALISNKDFEAINALIEDEDEKYANARNLAAGTLAVDEKKAHLVKERKVTFKAFTLVDIGDDPGINLGSWGTRMEFLSELGFAVVEYEAASKESLPQVVDRWTRKVETNEFDYPVDGLVITYDDVAYASSGSVTGHHATRAGYAFKWPDESKTTPLDHIEWSCATSVITPVAVFDPIQLEGTTVSRASLVNISEMERLGIGANGKTRVEVIKANKIIPKVIGVKQAEGTFEIPEFCPVCGEKTEVRISTAMKRTVKTLVCTNPDCAAKKLKKFVRFVSKEGLDIEGLSIETLRVLISRGFIHEFSDIFALKYHAAEISKLDGFGERSCEKLLQAIEKSRDVDAVNLIKSLSVPMVGRDAAKRIFAAIGFDGFTKAIQTPGERFERIPGIGPERSKAIIDWFSDMKNADEFSHLMREVRLKNAHNKVNSGGKCMRITFVITGEVHHYPNRDSFKAYVESEGGKVSGSVSKKTDYLVNNDVNSTSGKNKKAKELGVPIISEDEFVSKFVR